MDLNRRTFLKRTGTLAIGGLVLDAFGPLGRIAEALTLPPNGTLPVGTPILVVVDLMGGNDGLNTVVPVNSSWYYSSQWGHGSIAIPANTALALGGAPDVRLHNQLPWLASRWNNVGDVAIVQGSGENVAHEFSHFAAARYRQLGLFSGGTGSGWLGRYNDHVAAGSPVAGVTLTNGLHGSLIGDLTPVLSVPSCANFVFQLDWRWSTGYLNALQSMGGSGGASMLAKAQQNVTNTFAAKTQVSAANNPSYAKGGAPLITQLSQAAMLIQAGLPSQTYVCSFGGFDTHGSESWQHGDLMRQIDEGLSWFFSIIDGGARRNDVFVLLTSEFGRQITKNAGNGCDHGQGNHDIVLGGGVHGGVYGQYPNLDPGGPTKPNRINDAMVPTVDFRSVYATIVNRLGGDPNLTDAVLLSHFEDLGFFGVPNPGGGTPPSSTTTTSPPTTAPPTTRPPKPPRNDGVPPPTTMPAMG
jgi:uncharacterized protein (DUF1501 family)